MPHHPESVPDAASRGRVDQLLRVVSVSSVLFIDWPSRDVPDTLARAGYAVWVKGGPEADNYRACEVIGDTVVSRPTQQALERADLVYVHRPISELAGIVATATTLRAQAIWYQSGRTSTGANDSRACWLPAEESLRARAIVERAGMTYVDDVYLADRVRELKSDS
jgi:predicted CoA-binding protein